MPEDPTAHIDFEQLKQRAISQPLVSQLFTADPSAHIFNGRIYIYPSHDVDAGIPFDDLGSHFAMEDYHVFSMDKPGAEVKDHGIALHIRDVPWASKQLWAPDAAEKNGLYYLYFPAKNKEGRFQIGVAIGEQPEGPFVPEPQPIAGTYSIDPAVFEDVDGTFYLYFGGIWGGQLQSYRQHQFDPERIEPEPDEPALGPRVARLSTDMKSLAEPIREIKILDNQGNVLLAGDAERRFFEASWVHYHQGRYYFSYSTGDTHYICYATGESPYGPFVYQGRILEPVVGWTSHHSICKFGEQWFLFYHDSSLSNGITHLRCMKFTKLQHDEEGRIDTIKPYLQ
jgi:hypothetical protein